MSEQKATPSARQVELLEAAYRYVLENGLANLSLRPLAAAIGSSPRVLMFLFGNKDGLVRALLGRARADELALLDELGSGPGGDAPGLEAATAQVWSWLRAPEHRPLLRLWAESYARSLVEPNGAWATFASATVADWLAILNERGFSESGDGDDMARCTLALAVLRGCLLDLLATGDEARVDAAFQHYRSLTVISTSRATARS